MTKKLSYFLFIALIGFTACSDDSDDMPTTNDDPQTEDNSIVGVATANGSFTVLLDALERTGLTSTLQGEGDFTVFAPTDAAFDTLLTAMSMSSLDELETALTTDGLRNVLLYHVLGARVASSEVTSGFVNTLGVYNGEEGKNLSLHIDATSGVILNGNATVAMADVSADNGIIHVIDRVITPRNIVELASLSPDHTTLVAALGQAEGDLVSTLSGTTSYTVFAPVNDAFSAIQSTVDNLTPAQLATVLTYHVVAGNIRSDEVMAGAVTTVAEEDFTISTDNGVVITDANGGTSNVVATDIQGTNGVIHVLDAVLVPTL